MEQPATIKARYDQATSQLDALRGRIEKIDGLGDLDLCIYATGSYARREASQFSDLDLFFLASGDAAASGVSRTQKTLIDADLIRTAADLGFPPFSNDGQYLEVHHLDDMLNNLGSPADDFENFFTARILLLLESVPLCHSDLYRQMISRTIGAYYRDYHDHVEDFRPIFLVNDILRFWKTLCLNYEHRRNRETDDRTEIHKAHLKVLKLKFSRLLTCFSTVFLVVSRKNVIAPEDLMDMIDLTPIQRLERASSSVDGGLDLYEKIVEKYAWFLDATGKHQNDVLAWIGDQRNRDEAFAEARAFGNLMNSLLQQITRDQEFLRYLVM